MLKLCLLIFICLWLGCSFSHISDSDTPNLVTVDPNQRDEKPWLKGNLGIVPVAYRTKVHQIWYDPQSKRCFFSHQVEGANPYIGRLDTNHTLDIPDFIIDLENSNGFAVANETVIVSDGHLLLLYSAITARKIKRLELEIFKDKEVSSLLPFQGKILMACPNVGKVFAFDPNENIMQTWLEWKDAQYMVKHPELDIVTIANGTTIIDCDAQGKIIRQYDHSFQQIEGIAYNQDNKLYISDLSLATIFRIDRRNSKSVVLENIPSLGSIAVVGNELLFSNQDGLFKIPLR